MQEPLQRISIAASDDIAIPASVTEANVPGRFVESVSKCERTNVKLVDNSRKETEAPATKESVLKKSVNQSSIQLDASLHTAPEMVPPAPKNSVQFLAGWRQISKNSRMCFQYLKVCNGHNRVAIKILLLPSKLFVTFIRVAANQR